MTERSRCGSVRCGAVPRHSPMVLPGWSEAAGRVGGAGGGGRRGMGGRGGARRGACGRGAAQAPGARGRAARAGRGRRGGRSWTTISARLLAGVARRVERARCPSRRPSTLSQRGHSTVDSTPGSFGGRSSAVCSVPVHGCPIDAVTVGPRPHCSQDESGVSGARHHAEMSIADDATRFRATDPCVAAAQATSQSDVATAAGGVRVDRLRSRTWSCSDALAR